MHLKVSLTIRCRCRAFSLVRTKTMVWPRFSQLGRIISLSTVNLSSPLLHLTRHCLMTSRLSCSFFKNTCNRQAMSVKDCRSELQLRQAQMVCSAGTTHEITSGCYCYTLRVCAFWVESQPQVQSCVGLFVHELTDNHSEVQSRLACQWAVQIHTQTSRAKTWLL